MFVPFESGSRVYEDFMPRADERLLGTATVISYFRTDGQYKVQRDDGRVDYWVWHMTKLAEDPAN